MAVAYDPRFNALRNALYHTGRRLAFERLNRFFNFAVIALGTAAMSNLLARYEVDVILVGAAIALVGALQLVFDFGGRASEHKVLQRAYFEILAEIEEIGELDDEKIRKFNGKLMRIAADEPPVLRARDSKAYNDALAALGGYDDGERIILKLHHTLFGGIFPYEGYDFRKINELKQLKAL